MKSFIISLLIIFLNAVQAEATLHKIILNQDTSSAITRTYEYYDSQIDINDRDGNYLKALEDCRLGLALSKTNQDEHKEVEYHLKLSKYYYLTGQQENALKHLRLYALLKSTLTRNERDLELIQLEDAYLDEINTILLEMNMDKTLIQNLQRENERYYRGQKQIQTAIKIGLGALFLILVVAGYNRFRSKKDNVIIFRKEEEELKRLNEQVDKYEIELSRTDKELSKLKETQQLNVAYARSIQLSLLPSGLDLTDKILNSFVLYLPRDTISGDFYAVHSNGNKTVLAIFDCPGHGVNAAHSTVITHNLFKEIVNQGITAPSMVLTMMDQKLKREITQLDHSKEIVSGVKMAVCTIDQKTKELEYSGAHFPLFYVHLDELHFVRGNQFPIGDPLFSDKFYSSNNLRLSTGDMVYLSTDGYYSQIGGKKNKRFLRASLINLLKSVFTHEIEEQKFILEKVFHEWKSRDEQTDDVLIMGFRL